MSECSGLNSKVFEKGLKTGVVSVLEDLRSILSHYPTSVPQSVHIEKLLLYDALTKYVETPMLAVLNQSSADATYFGRVLLIWIFSISNVACSLKRLAIASFVSLLGNSEDNLEIVV